MATRVEIARARARVALARVSGKELPQSVINIANIDLIDADDTPEAQKKLAKIRKLYERRCAETVENFTEEEEMFLYDIRCVLDGDDDDESGVWEK